MFESMEEFREKILHLRVERKLHKSTEKEIAEFFNKNFPGSFVVPESTKRSLGHRADVVVHLVDGRTMHLEIIASPSMVSRDVDALENSSTDIQAAIILNDIDKKVAEEYFHELDNRKILYQSWPRFQLSEFLVTTKRDKLVGKIRRITSIGQSQRQLELSELRQPAVEWYVNRKESEKEVNTTFAILRKRRAPSLFVTGARGIGKSSFLNKIQMMAGKQEFLVIKRKVVDENWTQFVVELEKDVQDALRAQSQVSYSLEHRTAAPSEILVGTIKELIGKLKKPIVFIIDQFERLFERGEIKATEVEIDKVWRAFTSMVEGFSASQQVLWIIAARRHFYFLIFPRFGSLKEYGFSYVCVPPFTIEESENLVNKISRLAGYQLTPDAKRVLVSNCGNHPQNIVLSFIKLCSEKTKETLIQEQEVMRTRPWIDVFENDIRKLRTQQERLTVFAMAHAGKEVCTFEEIRSKVVSQSQISESELRDVLRHIQNDLLLINQPIYDRFEFYHPRISDYIVEKYGAVFPRNGTLIV